MTFALAFPGQGSQSVAMMAPFESLPAVRETFDIANAALGFDIWALLRDGPAEELEKTINTQPVMLAAGVALWRAWKTLGGPDPLVVAGHSLGEYTAMVAAGVLDFSEAMKFVRLRAQVMQEAVPAGQGAMAAILGLDDDVVRSVCEEASAAGVAEPANYNSPGQVVIAGDTAGVNRAMELAKVQGAKRCVLLPMSVPSHCSLMRPAAERLSGPIQALQVRAPSLAFLNDVDAACETAPERIRDAMTRQLYNSVRWVEIVQAMAALGAKQVVECGPGGVLTGVNRRAAPEMKAVGLKDAQSLIDLIQTAKN
jgi:[acyl-carrier-protein] S-malonyltransferase